MSQIMNIDFQTPEFVQNIRKNGSILIQNWKPHLDALRENAVSIAERSYSWSKQTISHGINNLNRVYSGINKTQIEDALIKIRENQTVALAVFGGCIGGIIVIKVLIKWSRKRRKPSSDPTMRAVVAKNYNGLQALRIVNDFPLNATLERDEVLIRVKAASVDPMDIRILNGYGRVLRKRFLKYSKHAKSEFPIILGRECSGIVESVGDAVMTFDVGDEVWMCVPYWQPGLMCEHAVIKEPQLALKPKSLSFSEAAAIPYAAMITWEALVERGGLGPCSTTGKRVLIHAGSTPYGTMAIQLVKAWGGHVTTTVPTVGLPIVRILGADDVVVYSVTDFQEELYQRPKFDVVLNTIGSVLHASCLEVCVPGGKVISMVASPILTDQFGFFTGILVAIYLHIRAWLWKLRNGNLLSSAWETFEFNRDVLNHIAHMIDVGQVRPVVEEVFPLEEARLAFHRVAEGQAVGRIIVAMPQLYKKV